MDNNRLTTLIAGGESSTVEFTRDDAKSDSLAREIVALLNSYGGTLLLGVEDDGQVSGLIRTARKAEERIFTICSNNIEPAVIPEWQAADIDGKRIGILRLPPDSAHKPYRVKSTGKYLLRAGSISRECSREELGRLFASSPVGETFMSRAVINARFPELDTRRLYDYAAMRDITLPHEIGNDEWHRLLINWELMTDDAYLTVAGTLLFAAHPRRLLKQAGITAVAYDGTERDAPARERGKLLQPLTPLFSSHGKRHQLLEEGQVEAALHFIQRNIGVREPQIDGRLEQQWDFPLDALREVVINALLHRDYSLPSDIALEIFRDRIEITSPGGLINSMTVERMKNGVRATRNQLLVDIMSDYRYAESTGRGISSIVIPRMREHNNTEPEFIADETRFVVILRRA